MAKEPTESRQLDSDLGWMLGALFRSYVKAAESSLQDLPGGARGYQVLTAAVGDLPRNQGAIAEELGIDRTVLTYLIDDLERLDLVVRRPDPADRRSRLVIATDTGRAAWEERRKALDHVEAHILSPLPSARAATFRALLQQLACAAQTLDPLDDLCQVALQMHPTADSSAARPTVTRASRRSQPAPPAPAR